MLSYAEQASISCPSCNHSFAVEIWVLVDQAARPDLVERIRTGSLHTMVCPRCGQLIELVAPLLIHRSDDDHPILFSPPPGRSANDEEGKEWATQLVGILRQRLGTAWRDEWLTGGIVSVRRALLPDSVIRDVDTLRQAASSTLDGTLSQFFEVDTWDAAQHFVKAHPELLNEATDIALARILNLNDHPEAREAILERLDLLRRCRAVGVDAAFDEKRQSPDTLLQELAQAEQAGDWHRTIELCRQGLRLIDRESDVFGFGMLHGALGHALYKYRGGERAENLELSIHHHQQALEVFTRNEFPERWALNHSSLAATYMVRIRGEWAENQELALQHFQLSLEVYTRKDRPNDWAMIQNNLMAIYLMRRSGDKSENQEQALYHAEQALQVCSPTNHPDRWASLQGNLGIEYKNRAQGDRADNLEQAIDHFLRALEVYNQQSFRNEWADTHESLAEAYRLRIRGERAENLEMAIYHLQQSLEVSSREEFAHDWASAHNSLAGIYCDRIIGDSAENIEQAIRCAMKALEVYTRESSPDGWSSSYSHLAIAYLKRVHGDRAENLEQAIYCAKQALEVDSRHADPETWAGLQNNLANMYRERLLGDRAENLEQAIHCCQQALEVFTQDQYPDTWGGIQHHLGTNYWNRLKGDRAENLKQSLHHYQQALQIRSLDRSPADHRQTQGDLANLLFYRNEWESAHAAYQTAIEAGRMLYESSFTERGRRAEIGDTSPLQLNDAYCLLRLDRPSEALLRMENAKTRLWAEVLALSGLDLTNLSEEQQRAIREGREKVDRLEDEIRMRPLAAGHGDDRGLADGLRKARTELHGLIELIRNERPEFSSVGLDLSELLDLIPPAGALVAPLFTPEGSAIFVIEHGAKSVTIDHVIWLNQFTLGRLAAGHASWLDAYGNRPVDQESWLTTIESTMSALWGELFCHVHDRLKRLKIADGSPVVLMPQGRLGLLPLHAAWREVDGKKRTFLDDYVVSYAPSGTALQVSRRRLADRSGKRGSLLSVVNPTADLRFTTIEAAAIAALFDASDTRVLSEQDATPEAVFKEASGSSYLHFSCHGFYSWTDPLRSGLLLVDKIPLTLADIISNMDLTDARLVTLSACETGVIEFEKSPEEHVGLPAGFLQAGSPAVVSSLWAVNDFSTSLLMGEFYRRHLTDGQSIAAALRGAQLWLRDLTRNQVLDLIEPVRERIRSDDPSLYEAVAGLYWHLLQDFAETDCPFAHPYHWGAFTASGAVS